MNSMKKNLTLGFVMVGFILLNGQVDVRADDGAKNNQVVEVLDDVIQPGGMFNVLSYGTSADFALKDTGLKEAGLASGLVILQSDEIRIFSSRDAMNASPLARIWLMKNAGGVSYQFQTGGEGSAEAFIIPKGSVIIVWTRVTASPISWTNVFR